MHAVVPAALQPYDRGTSGSCLDVASDECSCMQSCRPRFPCDSSSPAPPALECSNLVEAPTSVYCACNKWGAAGCCTFLSTPEFTPAGNGGSASTARSSNLDQSSRPR